MTQIQEWFSQNPVALWIIAILIILFLLWLILRHHSSQSSNSGNGQGTGSGSGGGQGSGSGGGGNSNGSGQGGSSGGGESGSDDSDANTEGNSGESASGSGQGSGQGGSSAGNDESDDFDDSDDMGATAAEIMREIEREQYLQEQKARLLAERREEERQMRMMRARRVGSGMGVGSEAGNSDLDWGDIRANRNIPDWIYAINRSISHKASRMRANGDQKKTYQRYNSRSMRFGKVIRPRTLTISKPDKLSVYVGVDTSGSMSQYAGSDLAVEAVSQILRQDKYDAHLACIDRRLYPWQSADDLKRRIRFKGGGGTYMSTFFEEVLNIKKKPTEDLPEPDVTVLITDGELDDADWRRMTELSNLYKGKGISMFILLTNTRVSCPAELTKVAKVFYCTK